MHNMTHMFHKQHVVRLQVGATVVAVLHVVRLQVGATVVAVILDDSRPAKHLSHVVTFATLRSE